jgi:hypothetical protein
MFLEAARQCMTISLSGQVMALTLYCNRFTHFKNALVCAVNCHYRTRCQDFALFYDTHREDLDALVAKYYDARTADNQKNMDAPLPIANAIEMRALISLEVKRHMPETTYIWIGKEGQAELLEMDEIIRRAERGTKAKQIFKVAQEMELRFQLVPRKGIEKAKRTAAAEAERAVARRGASRRTRRPVAVEAASLTSNESTVNKPVTAAPTRHAARRPRLAKASGE